MPYSSRTTAAVSLIVPGKRIDETIAVEMLRAVTPMAIEAAEAAERMLRAAAAR